MINLSQKERESTNLSLIEKIKKLRNPDTYLMENIKDYKTELPNINFQWYRWFPIPNKSIKLAYLIFNNVGIKKMKLNGFVAPNWYIIHDESGHEMMYSSSEDKILMKQKIFEEQHKTGVSNGESYNLIVRYLIGYKLPTICEIHNNQDKVETLVKKIKDIESK